MSQLNIELFKKIREKIAAVPEAYDQEQYGRAAENAPCGTAGCIAGWACVLGDAMPIDLMRHARIGDPINAERELYKIIPEQAAELLCLSPEEAAVLFTSTPEGGYGEDDDDVDRGWPDPFGYQWAYASRAERAEIAVAYLDHIVETGRVLE